MTTAARVSLVLLWLLALPATAEEPPGQLWQSLRSASVEQAFNGTLVHIQAGHVDTFLLQRRFDARGRCVDQISSLSGKSRHIDGDFGPLDWSGSQLAAALPDLRWQTAPDAIPGSAGSRYRLRLLAEDRVAGRLARVLEVQALDAARYSYEIWVDRETGVALRTRTKADATVLEEYLFTGIEIGPRQERAAAPESTAGARAELIDGFWLAGRFPLDDDDSSGGEHRVYSDGLALVSVYLEPLQPNVSVLARGQRGAMAVAGEISPPWRLTAVGAVPGVTLERILGAAIEELPAER